ncbi:sensor histidine kinase [Motiliproteus sp.]|uniref:sensor histidine kinase n=1 Tax=Motiliproteus sp. TaxID=1898955 RepID=UPI003BABC6BE
MSNDAKLDFATLLASSVHDMKNSIALMMHQINQLPPQTDDSGVDVGRLQLEANRLNNSLIQLMMLYKVENQQYQSLFDEHYLDEFIEDVVLMNQPTLEPWGIAIEQQVDPDLCWTFDKNLVVGVLGNIVTNVIRYARSKVLIQVRESDGFLSLAVEDDGPGYPDPMLGELEKRRMGVDFGSGSTGFGLYFSVLVAEHHRQGDRCGRVRLSNGGQLGGGCFELILP